MSDQHDGDKVADATLGLIEQLSSGGFFDQIKELDTNIKQIVGDLEVLGGLATQRVQETENLAAHLLAVEAILAVILRTYPVDPEAVQAVIREMTNRTADDPAENDVAQSVVNNLLAKS
jgi:hypothetical protein